MAGDADAERYAAAAQALMDDPNCDGVLAILTPQAMSDPTATAKALVEVARTHQLKPLLTSFMGEIKVADGMRILRDAHVPTFDTPEDAVRRLHVHVPVHAQPREPLRDAGGHPPRLRARTATPSRRSSSTSPARAARSSASPRPRTCSTRTRSRAVKTIVATTAEECAKAAEEIGFPVAIKILSHDITHKSDVGGIALNVRSAPEAANQFAKITERVQAGDAGGDDHRRRRPGHEPRRLRGHPRLQEGPHLRPGA